MNDINELREHMFATLRGLRDEQNPMDIDRAKAIAAVAGTIIDSARVEVEFAKVTGRESGTKFLPAPESEPLPPGITSARQHRIKG